MTDDPSNNLEMRRRQLKVQMSTVHTRRQQAVCVRRAYKRYGTKNNPCVVLDGLNMTVPKGTIYGLLGASGCGKTTLLNCIVGRKRLNSGEIWVLGGAPGTKGSGVPGPRVGYMPQETALYGEFTIRETLKYFGWIANMSTDQVEQRLQFLVGFLMLPDADRQVKNLSGGQQRRVSLAATLIHEPELLILDEPTVGVDPLLRQNIWDHLVEITKNGGTTVIITTHYIDETRQAHLIGLMRGGYLLAEESPEQLIQHYAADSLEDVFLKLSVIQNMGKRRRSSILQSVTETIQVPSGAVVNEAVILDDGDAVSGEISGEFGDNVSMSSRGGGRVSNVPDPEASTVSAPPPITEFDVQSIEIPPEEIAPPTTPLDWLRLVKAHHMRALIWKNFLWMWRNAPVMAFIIGLPVAQIVLFCLSIGHDPTGLPLSVVNYELNAHDQCAHLKAASSGCNSSRLSCDYLMYLEKRTHKLHYYETVEGGKESVRRGKTWATLVFAQNFSEALKSRLNNGRSVPLIDLAASTVDVYQDKSNENIGSYINRDLYFAFEDFFQDYLESCDLDRKIGTIPIRWERPVYGYNTPDFTDFAAPGVILTIIFFLAVALTSGAMLLERNEGILERSLVNGLTGLELLFAHVITQFIVMAGQSAMALVFAFAVFDISLNGALYLVVILTLITGLGGMCFGFVVAITCENERSATYLAMGSFLPMVMLCGIIWPTEAMHDSLKIVSVVLPLTKATESMRSMMARGWGIDDPEVYNGFIAMLAWIVIFLTMSILFLKFKKG